jgi:hypothetical protein
MKSSRIFADLFAVADLLPLCGFWRFSPTDAEVPVNSLAAAGAMQNGLANRAAGVSCERTMSSLLSIFLESFSDVSATMR